MDSDVCFLQNTSQSSHSHLSPHTKHSEVTKSSPFFCETFRRRGKTRESPKASLCWCRRTELGKKKKKKKRTPLCCLLSFPPHQCRAPDHQRAPGRLQSHARHVRVWFTAQPRGPRAPRGAGGASHVNKSCDAVISSCADDSSCIVHLCHCRRFENGNVADAGPDSPPVLYVYI